MGNDLIICQTTVAYKDNEGELYVLTWKYEKTRRDTLLNIKASDRIVYIAQSICRNRIIPKPTHVLAHIGKCVKMI